MHKPGEGRMVNQWKKETEEKLYWLYDSFNLPTSCLSSWSLSRRNHNLIIIFLSVLPWHKWKVIDKLYFFKRCSAVCILCLGVSHTGALSSFYISYHIYKPSPALASNRGESSPPTLSEFCKNETRQWSPGDPQEGLRDCATLPALPKPWFSIWVCFCCVHLNTLTPLWIIKEKKNQARARRFLKANVVHRGFFESLCIKWQK